MTVDAPMVNDGWRKPFPFVRKNSSGCVRNMPALWKHRELIKQLLIREIKKEYRGTLLGFFWAVLSPFLDLMIYSFVFGMLFNTRIAPPSDTAVVIPYGIILLAGLLPYNVLSEILNASPMIILTHVNYVKKVRFPLEVLPVVRLGVALFHGAISFGVLLVGMLFWVHEWHWTALLLPILLLPLVELALGMSWLLAGLGVYFRDLQKFIGVFLRLWFFGTPIVYSASYLPDWAAFLVRFNPLAFFVENMRNILLWGIPIDWVTWIQWTLALSLVFGTGFMVFQRVRGGFADVL